MDLNCKYTADFLPIFRRVSPARIGEIVTYRLPRLMVNGVGRHYWRQYCQRFIWQHMKTAKLNHTLLHNNAYPVRPFEFRGPLHGVLVAWQSCAKNTRSKLRCI
eukprot:scaffold316191_cov17-Prasinocladus_malaysianus.AAC.1